MQKLSVKELLSFGWTTFKRRPWFFVGTFALYMVVQFVMGGLQEAVPGIPSFLLSLIVSTLLYIGLIHLYLKAHDAPESAQFSDLWYPGPFWPYLGLSLLLGAAVLIGLILLIVPGIIIALATSFAGYLAIEKGMNPVAAIKESLRLTKGNRVKLFLFGLAVAGLGILGMIPLFLGLFIVAPVSMLAGVHAYKTLTKV